MVVERPRARLDSRGLPVAERPSERGGDGLDTDAENREPDDLRGRNRHAVVIDEADGPGPRLPRLG